MNDDGDDPLTSFYSHQYKDEIINRSYDQLLALADSIHDFGKGYRNIPLSSGVNEATRFLRNGVIGESGWDMLKTGYNNIEATNRSFFETEANISWIGPIQTKLSFEELNTEKAKELRLNYTSIEIEPTSTTIKALAEPGNKAGAILLENVRDFIITFLFGEPNSECYFASDADAKQVKKILSSSTTAAGMIFPQTLADSAITSLGKSLTQKPDEYYFPCDERGGREFTSTSNNFTAAYGCRIKYINGDESDTNRFSFSTPYAWSQQIEFGGAGASIVLGPSTGVEGPSVDQLLQLQVKTRSATTVPVVKSSKASQVELYKYIDDIYSSIRSGITALPPTHSLYMDIKRGGDQDQCLAVRYARRDKGFVALITGDITCAIKNRCYDNPTIEHYNDRIRLYRSSISERILRKHEILKLQYARYSAELKKLEPIIGYFIAESKPLSMGALIDRLPASEKKDDLSVYLSTIDVAMLSSSGYTPFRFEDIDALLEGKTPEEQASLLSEKLDSLTPNITRARELVNQIIELTSVADTPLMTIEFLSWLIIQDAPLDPAVSYPEIRYDPELIKPVKPTLASDTPYNIIQTIDNYNKKIIAYYNSFFNKRISDNLLIENSITFKGDNTAIERVRGLLLRIYQISVNKKTLRDLYTSTPAAIIAIWDAALNTFLVYIDNATNASGLLLSTQLDNFIRTFMATEKNEAVKNFIIGDDRPVADKSVKTIRKERTSRREEVMRIAKKQHSLRLLTPKKNIMKDMEEQSRRRMITRARRRIMSQRGGAACITKVDIREELYDFFGIIAADFRTALFEAYPELSLYIRIQDATPEQFLELRELYQKITETDATTINSIDDLRAAVASLDLTKYDVPEIYDSVSVLVRNSIKYIELFNNIVVSKFQEEGGYADDALCNNHKELITNISNQLSELDVRKIILLSLVYEIMIKNADVSSYFKLVRPELFSINIDILSDEGIRKLNLLINTLNNVPNMRISVEAVSLLRGGSRLRKTHRRYSQRHYKQRQRRKRTGKR